MCQVMRFAGIQAQLRLKLIKQLNFTAEQQREK